MCRTIIVFTFFFFNDTATTEIYTLSLHDALPIFRERAAVEQGVVQGVADEIALDADAAGRVRLRIGVDEQRLRSEEHTSELQSRPHLVCRLLLEKKTYHDLLSRLLTEFLILQLSL